LSSLNCEIPQDLIYWCCMTHYFKPFFWVSAWLFLSTGVILTGIATYHYLLVQTQLNDRLASSSVTMSSAGDDSDSTGQIKGMTSIIETDDARPQIVANFLQRYSSPLTPYDVYGAKLVDIADRHGLDFRLLPAIAMQESNLCKKIPEGSYNCLGFGIHAKGTLEFESYEANFERAARELKKNYIDQGRTTPEQIMKKYTPSSNGSWAESVNQWMSEMRYNDRKLGQQLDETANVLEFAQPATATPAASKPASSSATPKPSATPASPN
jgi:hypothetical protein